MYSLRAAYLPVLFQFNMSVHSKDEQVSEIILTSVNLQVSYSSKPEMKIIWLKILV